MLHWILDPEAARLHIKGTVGKNISCAALIYTSIGRDSLYLLCAPRGEALEEQWLCQAPAACPEPAVQRGC